MPASLGRALDALEGSAVFRRQLGEVFVAYYAKIKRSELTRYLRWLDETRTSDAEPTQWEQDEYFDFF